MKHTLCIIAILAASVTGRCAPPDSLFAIAGPGGWTFLQRVLPAETVASVARRFHVPHMVMSAANGLGAAEHFPAATLAVIPLGPYNMLAEPLAVASEMRPLFYRFNTGDRLHEIARKSGLTVRAFAERNVLGNGDPLPGRVLTIGWVRFDATLTATVPDNEDSSDALATIDTALNPVSNDSKPPEVPKVAAPSLSQLYKEQTLDGANVIKEKGSVGFFPLKDDAKGAAVYAFHNTAYKGAVMIVRNLNNGKAIYVKVLGPLPPTKAFIGCILGLSSRAKAALGVQERKAFCELSYAGY